VAVPVFHAVEEGMLRPPIPNRVLVVDDEPLIRWSLCTALEAAGFDAVAASSAVEARRLATEWPPPRVAIVDLLNIQDTGDLLDAITRIYPDCRFVVMTTARQYHPRRREDRIQMIDKPFDLNALVSLVRVMVHCELDTAVTST
jgi:DNA-binding NtrC family response regulator